MKRDIQETLQLLHKLRNKKKKSFNNTDDITVEIGYDGYE